MFSQAGNTYEDDETEETDDAQSFESEKSEAVYSSLQNTGIFFGEDKLSEITVEIENADKFENDEAEKVETVDVVQPQVTSEETIQTVTDLLQERDEPLDS